MRLLRCFHNRLRGSGSGGIVMLRGLLRMNSNRFTARPIQAVNGEHIQSLCILWVDFEYMFQMTHRLFRRFGKRCGPHQGLFVFGFPFVNLAQEIPGHCLLPQLRCGNYFAQYYTGLHKALHKRKVIPRCGVRKVSTSIVLLLRLIIPCQCKAALARDGGIVGLIAVKIELPPVGAGQEKRIKPGVCIRMTPRIGLQKVRYWQAFVQNWLPVPTPFG